MSLVRNALVYLLSFLIGSNLLIAGVLAGLRIPAGSWLPMVVCLLFAMLLGMVPQIKGSVTHIAWVIGLWGATTTFWCLSELPPTSQTLHMASLIPKVAIVLPLLCGLLVMVCEGELARLPLRSWLLLSAIFFFYVLVSYFSSSTGGGGHMSHFMVERLHFSPEFAEAILFPLRKTIHFTFYGLVGLTAWRFGVAAITDKAKQKRLVFCLLVPLLLASFDEMRQSTQPGRTGAVTDVMLDMAGAITFIGIAEFIRSRSRNIPEA